MKNILTTIIFNTKVHKKVIIGWFLAIVSIMTLYMSLFPQVQEIAQAKIDAMPEEILDFIGLNSLKDMSNYVSYFGMVYKILTIIISIFATTYGANLISKEETNKTILFLSNLSITRKQIFISKLLTGILTIIIINIGLAISSLCCGLLIANDSFNAINIIKITLLSTYIPIIFMIIGIFIASIETKYNSAMISSLVIIISYFLGYLKSILDGKADWLKYFSPFELFSPEIALNLDFNSLITSSIYLIFVIILIFLGSICYKKRDYAL